VWPGAQPERPDGALFAFGGLSQKVRGEAVECVIAPWHRPGDHAPMHSDRRPRKPSPSTLARRAGRAAAWLVVVGGLAAPALAGSLPACPADPFAPLAPADRDASLARPCGGEHMRWHVEPPDPIAAQRRNGVLRARVESVASEPIWPGLVTGTVKASYVALGGEPASGLRTERSVLSAGGLVRLSEQWSLHSDAGRELTSERNLATLGGAWRSIGAGLVFAEFIAGDGGAEAHRIGARWWLLPKRLSLDLDARRDVGPVEQRRYGLLLQLRP